MLGESLWITNTQCQHIPRRLEKTAATMCIMCGVSPFHARRLCFGSTGNLELLRGRPVAPP